MNYSESNHCANRVVHFLPQRISEHILQLVFRNDCANGVWQYHRRCYSLSDSSNCAQKTINTKSCRNLLSVIDSRFCPSEHIRILEYFCFDCLSPEMQHFRLFPEQWALNSLCVFFIQVLVFTATLYPLSTISSTALFVNRSRCEMNLCF